MKRLNLLIAVLTVLIVLCLEKNGRAANDHQREQSEIKSDWLALSISAQNANASFEFFQRARKNQSPELEAYSERMNRRAQDVTVALSKLVESRQLDNLEFQLKASRDLPVDGFEAIAEFAKSMQNEYGYYSALELVGLGVNFRSAKRLRNEPIKLNVFLPFNRVADFKELLEKHGLLTPDADGG